MCVLSQLGTNLMKYWHHRMWLIKGDSYWLQLNQTCTNQEKKKTRKSKSPCLNVGLKHWKENKLDQKSPQKRGVCTLVVTKNTEKTELQHYVNTRRVDFLTGKETRMPYIPGRRTQLTRT